MSILGKQWVVNNSDFNLSAWDRVASGRDMTALEVNQFHDPFLMKDMNKAVARIEKAIKDGERIVIFGDYDVDGITSTAILYLILTELGASVSYRLPHRINDGYGLHNKYVDELADAGVTLIITVDCGISCALEVARANERGIDVIVTDHHQIPKVLPEAHAILHPLQKDCPYPNKDLVGAGVAFKLACALIEKLLPESERSERIAQFTDLASMGTVADCAPILNENRLIVKRGLQQLGSDCWPGLSALKEVAGVKPDQEMSTYHIGFVLGPRINAVGRIDSPYYALQMLIQDHQKAKTLAEHLELVNQKRRTMTSDFTEAADKQVQDQIGNKKILIAHAPEWHAGVIGLVAGKLSNKYNMPALVMQEQGDKVVASARGPEGFDWGEALRDLSDHLDRFGGHECAAGLSMKPENLKSFKQALWDYAQDKHSQTIFDDALKIDAEVKPEELDFVFYNQIQRLKPFGIGNEQPIFKLSQQKLVDVKQIGKTKDHIAGKVISDNSASIRFVGFGLGEAINKISNCNDIVCQLELNSFQGKDNLELRIIDIGV